MDAMNSTVPTDTLTGIPVASQEFTTMVLGPEIIGWLLEFVLFGAVLSQFAAYLSSPAAASEQPRIKYFLYTVIALAFLQNFEDCATLYHYSTWQIRDTNTLAGRTLLDNFGTLAVGLEGALVQGFLALRAAKLFEDKRARFFFYFVVGSAIIIGLFGSISYVAEVLVSYAIGDAYNPPVSYNIVIGCWLWGSAFVDVVITLTLILLLRKKVVGFNETTDSILIAVIRLAIETASYTATSAFLGAVLTVGISATSLGSNAAVAFWQPLSSMYALSLLTTLNARAEFRSKAASSYVSKQSNSLGSHQRMPDVGGHVVKLPIHVSTVSSRVREEGGLEEYEMGTAKKSAINWQKDLPGKTKGGYVYEEDV